MNIYFSRHAGRQMKWRDIDEKEVAETIEFPEKVEDASNDRKNAFKQIGKKWLKVTFRRESDMVVIITAIDKNK